MLIASPSSPSVRLTAFDAANQHEDRKRHVPPAEIGNERS